MKKYIAYYRVSTVKQGQSGLGLEAQRAAVSQHVKGKGEIVAEYTEVESGKRDNRLQLAQAIEHAKKSGATLVIAKLDRLSRNAAFIFTLKDSGVDFVCADMPEANTMSIGIFAVLAQHERELISSRTRAALQAKKKQGYKLGTPANLTREAQQKAVQAIKEKASANSNIRRASNYIKFLRNGESLTWQQIADRLNAEGFLTSQGKPFQPMQVYRIYNKAAV